MAILTKRFLLFAGLNDEQAVGWEHFITAFDTEGEARASAAIQKEAYALSDWVQVVDLSTLKVIYGRGTE